MIRRPYLGLPDGLSESLYEGGYRVDEEVQRRALEWSADVALEAHLENPEEPGALLALRRAALTRAEPGKRPTNGPFSGMERRPPQWRGWNELPVRFNDLMLATERSCLARSWWQRDKVQLVSQLAMFNPEFGPEWKVAVRRAGRERPKGNDVERALRDFDMRDSFEHNDYPGAWRTFFASVNPSTPRRALVGEQIIVERDGYRWSNPIDGPCRGCLHALSEGVRCSVHAIESR